MTKLPDPTAPPPEERLAAIFAFVQAVEPLKDTLRSAHSAGGRPESTAEHSWRLALLAMSCEPELPGIDMLKLLKICLIHDLGEAVTGDTPAPAQSADGGRHRREGEAVAKLCASLPGALGAEISGLWAEYEAAETPEAILAKGFDKIETLMQHAVGLNPAGFDYAFNLDYGRKQTERHPLLRRLRDLADRETRKRLAEQCPEERNPEEPGPQV